MLVLFFDRSEGNFDNEFIRALFDPDPDYMTSKLSDILVLSSFETYWNYMGSLTVPPCTENVSWTIVDATRPISRNQLDKHFWNQFRDNVEFTGYNGEGEGNDGERGNNRRVQPLGQRRLAYK